jgi:hypothetical protein
MLEFTEPLKIYLFKDTCEVKLSIRINNRVADTYSIAKPVFEQLLLAAQDSHGWPIRGEPVSWYAQHKQQGLPTEYVRVTASYAGVARDYRFDISDIRRLAAEYRHQCDNRMRWDS